MDEFLKSVFKDKRYKKIPLTGEGSDRSYIRVKTDDSSWILACSPMDQQKKFLLKQKDFSLAGLNVPKGVAQDSEGGFLLLEDLGDHSLEKEVLEEKGFAYYFPALDQVIKLQASQTGEGRHHSFDWSFFKKEDFFKEMLWTEEHLIKRFLCLAPEESFRRGYLEEWNFLCEELVSFPFFPSHRDYHSRNLFIKDKQIYLIDFQDAGFFPRFYDVVSLVYDVYVASQMNNALRKKLLDYFLLKGFGEREMTNELRQEISVTLIQRLFKACGSFASFYSLKKQRTHLPYIQPALQMVREELCEVKRYPHFLSLIDLCLEKLKKTNIEGSN